MKYIVLRLEDPRGTIEVPITFPEMLVHSDVAMAIRRGCEGMGRAQVVGAGFFSSTGMGIECHGKSESLNVASRGKEDSKLFPMYDYHHGIIA